ncbi:c-type cytochrome [Sphingomonas sp. JC676]|uniref:c-type cytochrome n=1 Tax=Sphingomonas sp. JC676 TaxID=2768065 RepID=UPI001657E94C|nr:c-type cytochrome [Sphingomonas sp. JC676]MBC9033664.1 c-type cytochrome [Sphingomonas sp. JC676]
MRFVRRAVAALVGLLLLFAAVVYGGSEWLIRRSHAVPLTAVTLPKDAASIEEGGRLAKLAGCRGCHGPNGEGTVWTDIPWFIGHPAPPSIARKTADYSDPELVRLIQHGVRKDGSSLFIMPTDAHRNLADDDVLKIAAWIRTLKFTPKDSVVGSSWGPMGRFLMLTGEMAPSIQVEKVAPEHRPADIGRYYYDAVCSECHELHKPKPFEGGKQIAPALAPMAASYDSATFHKLLKTGVPPGGRNLGVMKDVAVEGAYAFTDAEVDALQAYLKGEATRAATQ